MISVIVLRKVIVERAPMGSAIFQVLIRKIVRNSFTILPKWPNMLTRSRPVYWGGKPHMT